ncbi:preprotein translocase subunit SecY, partial [Candidatus Woesearchaeota archaeon]
MSLVEQLVRFIPEVVSPTQKKVSFKVKLKWTLTTLILFFVLGFIPLLGLGQNALSQFEYLSIILGAKFGSILSLGIGPLVTSSIVLQLLNGSGLVKFDTHTPEGKRKFQSTQKLLSIFFIVFEAFVYVLMGGLAPATPGIAIKLLLVAQLIIGGLLIMLMDEVITKWGFGSGISLFIAAGVSESLFIRMFSPLRADGGLGGFVGAIPEFFRLLTIQDASGAALALWGVIATVLIFLVAVYAQAMKVEIPLSFGRVRGHGIRWPLSFLYTSNIPVILIAALLANIQLWARLLQNWGYPILGTFVGNQPASGLVAWLTPTHIVQAIVTGTFSFTTLLHSLVYISIFVVGSVIFSIFWVQTSGMDARSQAKNILASGLQMPGFRKDARVLEQILDRYIGPLTVMGGTSIGLLASLADLLGA